MLAKGQLQQNGVKPLHEIIASLEWPALQKLLFLRSKLKGEPWDILRDLHLNNSNYLVAWQMLDKKYDSPTTKHAQPI